MSKYYDDQGNEVEAYSKEELETMIADKLKEKGDSATSLDPIMERLARAESSLNEMRIEKFADMFAGNDADKRSAFISKFGRLTGYEETPDGMAERAKDAAKLAFGDQKENLSGLAAVDGVGGAAPTTISPTNVDSEVQKALGITAEDVDKYGKKQ